MIVRASVCLGAALVLAWLSASAAASAVWAQVRPELASRSIVARGPALEQSALLAMAEMMQRKGQAASTALPSDVPQQSVRLAKMAFAREPLAADAIGLLGLAANAHGQAKAADALFTDVHSLTKRNAMADLWLARRAAENRDMPHALEHFDELLRATTAVREPILQQVALATRDASFRQGVTKLLAADPAWAPDFWRIAPTVPGAASPVAQIRADLAGKGMKFDPDADKALALALLNEHDFDAAGALYRKVTHENGTGGEKVRNGRFDKVPVLPPIDWMIYSVGDFGSEIVPSSKRMYISAAGNPGGGVAREWVSLDPGRYVLQSALDIADTSGPGDRVIARLSCIETDAKQDFVLAEGNDRHDFAVPPGGCRNYWLDVVAVPADGSPGLDAELALLSITPATR